MANKMAPNQYQQYRDYDIENGQYSVAADNNKHIKQCPPSARQHPKNANLQASSDVTERSTEDENSHTHVQFKRNSNRKSSNAKNNHKPFKKSFRWLFRKDNNNDQIATKEHDALLSRHQQRQGGPSSNGTFDCDSLSSHPRSQDRLAHKWGTIKQQMNVEQWMATLDNARVLAFGGYEKDDGISRDEALREAQEKTRSLTQLSIWHCLAAILIYVSISAGVYSHWLENWTIIDSVYFAVVTFTTIGYGDVVPDTRMARLFTCGWALSGVACLGIALGVLGNHLIEVSEDQKRKAKGRQKAEVMGMFTVDDCTSNNYAVQRRNNGVRNDMNSNQSKYSDDGTTSQWSDLGYHGVEDATTVFADTDNDEDTSWCREILCSSKVHRCFLLVAFLTVTLYFIMKEENWNGWTTFYYGLITASTVGYGDISPQTETGRLLAILYIPIAVGLMGTFLDIVASSIVAYQQGSVTDYWKDKELTLKDLRVMDEDGDGIVSKLEFIEFMLVATDQVDQETLDSMKEQFDRLDKDRSGTLDKADLIKLAQAKLNAERNIQ